jgi:predicted tellurium resistance membrane protein TerC
MFELFSTTEAWASLATLTAMEVVLGVDNIIFIAILCGALPQAQREIGRRVGLAGAFVTRLALLACASYIVQLTTPLFTVFSKELTGKALILLAGGLFLLYKATKEIHGKLEGDEHGSGGGRKKVTFRGVIFQILLLDLVFSVDSVITAVGMTPHLSIMVIANVVALAVMLLAGGYISRFVERHPSVKILALSFLIMIGTMLIAEGFGFHIPKGYIYFAMGFSVLVEFINIKATSRKAKPVTLHQTPRIEDASQTDAVAAP